jgi:hypothetical protein
MEDTPERTGRHRPERPGRARQGGVLVRTGRGRRRGRRARYRRLVRD